ncbi:TIGR02757 family protein [uncultured Fretibacterium sp.]|uniref:TIGR02757 family protein n=1 Tax=uncultured Fretibacterium sp. TaxID=1678694 RepID=UPI00260A673F|nr:TIGR02757 family protein [uncultured Fretibacterium sp.]
MCDNPSLPGNTAHPGKAVPPGLARLRPFLDGLYFVYNRRELIHPDPLLFLYRYNNPLDREIAGLVASSLAYGRVAQILKSVSRVLDPLGPRPHRFLSAYPGELSQILEGFKHRFTTAGEMENLLAHAARAQREHGSLEGLLCHCLERSHDLLSALDGFSDTLSPERRGFPLLTAPRDGSACKRLFLLLKWMVRRDDVDPGGWKVVAPRDLIMPTDTHIHAIALKLGLTKRKQADLVTALEITERFREIAPDDPTRYDFVLSRFGIRSGLHAEALSDLLGP